jgi:3-keto-5-aminohexanoate cleavage enzyme
MLEFATAILGAGVRPELELFDLGHLDNAAWLAAKAPLSGPQHHDLVLGVPGGAAGTPANVTLMAGRLPAGSTWSATGIGRSHLAVVMTAIAAGGHVRLGFEDQVELEPGRLAASNAELVERAARLGEIAGRPVASPQRAREILGLAA